MDETGKYYLFCVVLLWLIIIINHCHYPTVVGFITSKQLHGILVVASAFQSDTWNVTVNAHLLTVFQEESATPLPPL